MTAEAAEDVLYRSADLLVRHVPAGDSSRHVITFDHYHDDRTLDRRGFGEDFLRDRGIAATHVLSRGNDWFQYSDTPAALLAAQEAASGAGAVLAYGSSMGGYAAVRFADAVGATAALALSPQYSVDPAKMPGDRRWGQDGRRLRFLPELDGPITCRIRPVVAYDPRWLDRLQADRIAADTPIQRLPIPYAGHPAGAWLQEAGLLEPLIEDLLHGAFDPAATARAVRAARRRTSIHLANLADSQPRWRPGLAGRLAEEAVRLAPGRPQPLRALAGCLLAAGRHGEALAAFEALLACDRNPVYLLPYSEALHRAGDTAAALRVAHEIAAAWPRHAGTQHWIADLYTARGDLPAAVRHARQALALDPRNLGYRVLAALLSARARPRAPHVQAQAAWMRLRWALRRA